ncbi:ABC transporter ATP-binding protein [Paenalcaligenes hominis]|uniref:ABC transporter ATP-binding protein n=1 Tax=Paenalcaligenes hominis TaxID=643674 RepID=UPI003524F5C4
MNHDLYTENLGKTWGSFQANANLSLRFNAGARHAIIGPNGAGKTTFINLLTGVLSPTTGSVFLGDQNITALPQYQRVRLGMTRTFQINTLFAGLTVLESVLLVISERDGLHRHWFKPATAHHAAIEEAMVLLNTLQLVDQAHELTRSLPYGKQRLLEIALALATKPKILLLDEPAAGIPTQESAELFAVIAALPKDVTVLFIEHDMNLVFQFADFITVLVGGQCFAQGTPEQIANDPRVKEVYLGESNV